MFRRFIEALRVSTYFLLALSIWAIWSVGPFFANKPTDFQAAGSIVVAWAIFFYGRDRLFRENSIHTSNKALFVAAHNSVNARLEFHQSLAENTQNMNLLWYAKLLRILGVQDEALGDNHKAIENLEQKMDDRSEHFQLWDKTQKADIELKEQLEFSEEMGQTQGNWAKIIYRVELGLVVLGTLQWGYGDRWVVAAHSTFPSL